MKTISSFLLLVCTTLTLNAQSLAGSYETTTADGKLLIQLQPSGNGELTGSLTDEGGGSYAIQGVEEMGMAAGLLIASNGAQVYFEAYLEDAHLHFSIAPLTLYGEPDYNNVTEWTLTRTGSAAKSQAPAAVRPQAAAPPRDHYQRDQGLVGYWTYSESYTSGEYSFATQWKMQINPDGTYLYGDGQVAGGGPGISGSSGGGDVQQGFWRTENGVIYISTDGRNWEPYCGYYLEGYKLMFKFNDGSRQVWSRQ